MVLDIAIAVGFIPLYLFIYQQTKEIGKVNTRVGKLDTRLKNIEKNIETNMHFKG